MRFVNMTRRYVYNAVAGKVAPGAVSADGGKASRKLAEAIGEIVVACGSSLGIRLNEKEADLLNKLMTLDEKGAAFDPNTIPEEIRNDPTGVRRISRLDREAQRAEMARTAEANARSAAREAEINGEVLLRKPVGPATLETEGEKVSPADLKSGFERILEENARIAAGKSEKPKMDVGEALDPIGVHASKGSGAEMPKAAPAAEPVVTPMAARNVPGDVARNADAGDTPVPTAQDPKNAMDRQAAEIAKGLSVLSVLDNPPKPKAKGKGKAKKSDK